MASQVLSGSGNVSYTNNTGQNVRVIINFYSGVSTISWAGLTHNPNPSGGGGVTLGRNLAVSNNANFPISANNILSPSFIGSAPTEIMLTPAQTFSAVSTGVYNIVVIPEAG